MKNRQLKNYLLLTVLAVAAACGTQKPKPEALDTAVLHDDGKTAVVENVQQHPGEKIYDKNCKVCHQVNGQGVSSIFPPLTPNSFIEDKAQIIEIVLNGMKGDIEIDGENYNGLMTPHKHLSDQDIADVISYVRSSFGNELDPVTPEEVQSAR
ncbi:c-type cytochrome [Mangrovibacterium lignilyticum]|uniref:c-type cytochrome n=1 Tax=Mangrovibacterium lignilyticum TaxID=2668052 RepID=UPI0013D84EAD|nr:c-type cytochrome [Mangrovibacterium lignilyticum]